MTKDEEILKLRTELANANMVIAAITVAHGGWIVIEGSDFAKINSARTSILMEDGMKKGDVLLRVITL